MEIVGKIELVLLIFFNSGLPTKSQWITERPLQDIDYKFESISRYVETSPGGDRKAWFTIMMQAPNNAEPRASDRLTWMRVSNVNSDVSFFQANLTNTFIKEIKSYNIPIIWLSSGTDEFAFQMNEVSTTQTQFKGYSCQFGVEKKQNMDGKTHFKIILGNCDSIPYFYAQLTNEKNKNDKLLLLKLSKYFSETEEMASKADNTKYRTCTVDTLAIKAAGLRFKLDFIFSVLDENVGDDVLKGFMYMYNVLTI